MGHMKKYKCPSCLSTQTVVGFGRRKKVLRYYCKTCQKHFSVNPCFVNRKLILSDHLDGVSFRALARKYRLSPMTAWRICEEQLKRLPNNNQFTFNYCLRFSDTFIFDGKYFNVAGYDHDWVLLWGIDYFKHDIPVIWVAPSESYHSWSKFFFYRELKVRSNNTYRVFMARVETVLSDKLSDAVLTQKLFNLYRDYREDPVAVSVLTNIQRHLPELTGYRGIPHSPVTSNMIEGINSHLETRLFGLRSFQSITHARLWFNGYVLKRRLTKFTDCRGKFRSLNGKCGVELTKKPGIDIPRLF